MKLGGFEGGDLVEVQVDGENGRWHVYDVQMPCDVSARTVEDVSICGAPQGLVRASQRGGAGR